MKEQEKILEKINSEIEIICLPDNILKTLIIKMLSELRKRIDLSTGHFNKDLEELKKKQR